MKAIQGYVTDDGEFFEDKSEADLHERTIVMKKILEEDGMSEDILEWITKRKREITSYLNFGAQGNARSNVHGTKKSN